MANPSQSFVILLAYRHMVLIPLSIYKALQTTIKFNLCYPTQTEITQQFQRRRMLLGHIGTAKTRGTVKPSKTGAGGFLFGSVLPIIELGAVV